MIGSTAGAVLGLAVGASSLLVASRLAATRRPSLEERVLPYVHGIVPSPERSALTPLIQALLRPGRGLVARLSIDMALSRAGRSGERDRFRLEQLVGASLGALLGTVVGVLVVARGNSLLAVPLLAAIGAVSGLLLMQRRLQQLARQRSVRMGQQLPTVAELLAFAVAAGESPAAALERVSLMTEGELSAECRAAVGDVRVGATFDEALRGIADRSANTDIERFVDGIVVAVERGTPLVDVLRAQAADARAASRRALVESAGRRDVAMLIPVVFFILPTVVGIALYPGLQSLQLVVN